MKDRSLASSETAHHAYSSHLRAFYRYPFNLTLPSSGRLLCLSPSPSLSSIFVCFLFSSISLSSILYAEEGPNRPSFSEDPRPQLQSASSSSERSDEGGPHEDMDSHGWRLNLRGYARLPLMIAGGISGDRRPYLIDDQYDLSGFAYTRANEHEWVELFLSAEREQTRVVVGLFTSELSDWSQASLPQGQKGIATAFIDQRWSPSQHINLDARIGVFWERMGYIDAYDTYLFARTHIGGGRLTLTALDTFYLKVGLGAHQGDPTLQRGFTTMQWMSIGARWRWLDTALYGIKTQTNDGEYGDGPLQDTLTKEDIFIQVYGGDLYLKVPRVGQVHFGIAYIDAQNVLYLGDAHELLHSSGGGVDGLKSRYLGETGTGEILATTFELQWRVRETFTALFNALLKVVGDSQVRLFGMSAHVVSYGQSERPDQNFHDRHYLKWGAEALYRPRTLLKGYFLGARFDRVILDTDFDSLSFRVITPRFGYTPLEGIDFFMAYSLYAYGENIRLNSQQLRNQTIPTGYRHFDGPPDERVFKLQAQARW